MILLIVFFCLSILFSFLCSIWEAVLLSITPRYINQQKVSNPSFGETLEKYKSDIDRPLSAILTLNTIAHTVGAIGVGAQAGELFGDGDSLSILGFSLSYESLIAGVMTLAILLLSEIIPKTIGANYWKSLSGFTVTSLKFLLIVLYPLVWLSQWITKRLKKKEVGSVLSRSDFHSMAEEGEQSGVLEKNESTIIKNLIKLQEITVHDIMTPRTVFIAADESTLLKDFYDANQPLRFSRIPIYKDTIDNITGIILKDELLSNIIDKHGDKKLSEIRRDVVFVYDYTKLPDLLDKLSDNKGHLAIVVDKFGGTLGLVTMEDLMETLLGREITDEMDTIEDLQQYARNVWAKRAKKMGLLDR
jgi:CBS domain containing-hemolysin-like protein